MTDDKNKPTKPPEPAKKPPDSVKTVMPAGEEGSRNPPTLRSATASGGTSAAEDTTRTAGYVADLAAPRDQPPGPPIAKDPALFSHPDATPPPTHPKKRPTEAEQAAIDLARWEDESPAPRPKPRAR